MLKTYNFKENNLKKLKNKIIIMEKIFWQAQTHRLIQYGKNNKLEEVRMKKNGLLMKTFIAYSEKKTPEMLKKMEERKKLQNPEIAKLIDYTDFSNSNFAFYYEKLPYFSLYKDENKIEDILKKVLKILIDCKKSNYLPLTLHPEFLMSGENGFKLFFLGEEINEAERYQKEIDWKISQFFDKKCFDNIKKGVVPVNLKDRENCLVFCIGLMFASFLTYSEESEFTLLDNNGAYSLEIYEKFLNNLKNMKLKKKSLLDALVNMINLDIDKRPTLEECLKNIK